MSKLFWLDLETTGLHDDCAILEVAALITDINLNILEQMTTTVEQPGYVLDTMNDWCRKQHTASGLVLREMDSVLHVPRFKMPKGSLDLRDVEGMLLLVADRHFEPKDRIILCGNSIGFDRKRIERWMPRFEQRLHYRMLDVSSFKEWFSRKYNIEPKKKNAHRALDDILESIEEMAMYDRRMK